MEMWINYFASNVSLPSNAKKFQNYHYSKKMAQSTKKIKTRTRKIFIAFFMPST